MNLSRYNSEYRYELPVGQSAHAGAAVSNKFVPSPPPSPSLSGRTRRSTATSSCPPTPSPLSSNSHSGFGVGMRRSYDRPTPIVGSRAPVRASSLVTHSADGFLSNKAGAETRGAESNGSRLHGPDARALDPTSLSMRSIINNPQIDPHIPMEERVKLIAQARLRKIMGLPGPDEQTERFVSHFCDEGDVHATKYICT